MSGATPSFAQEKASDASLTDNKKISSPDASYTVSSDDKTNIIDNLGEITNETPGKPRDLHGFKWATVVLAILSSTFLFALDNTIVADVQPKIIKSLGHIEKLPWVPVAFSLGGIGACLLWGRLYALFNSKILYLSATVLFEAGSALCGAAPTMDALIVGRTLCGLGGSGIYVGALNILSALTTEPERPVYVSYIGATWGAGTVLGPVIGGAFSDSSATWRWSFYINLCVCALAAPVYFFLLPATYPQPSRSSSIRNRIQSIDFIGAVLFIGGAVSLIMAINFGGAVYTWDSGRIIGLFVCSGVLWILFVVQQFWCILTSEANRFFPATFIKSYEMCILFAQTATCIACIYIPIYFLPLYFQFVKDDGALEAGVRLLPFVCILVFAAMLNGAVMGMYGVYMPWFLAGGTLLTLGGALFQTVRVGTNTGVIYGYSVIIAFGAGSFAQAPFSVAQAKVEPRLVPLVTAFLSCGQIAGIELSLSIASSVFINEATNKITQILPRTPLATIQSAIAGTGSSFFKDLSTEERGKVLAAIVSTMDNLYIIVIVCGALAMILSLFMKREKLFTKPEAN